MASFGEELRRQRELRGSASGRSPTPPRSTSVSSRRSSGTSSSTFQVASSTRVHRAFARHIGVNPRRWSTPISRSSGDRTRATGRPRARPRRAGPAAGREAQRGDRNCRDHRDRSLAAGGYWYLRAGGEPRGEPRAGHRRADVWDHGPALPGPPPPRRRRPPGSSSRRATARLRPLLRRRPQGRRRARRRPRAGRAGLPAPVSGEPAPALPPRRPTMLCHRPRSLRPRGRGPGTPQPSLVVRVIPLQPSRLGLLCNGRRSIPGPWRPGRS